MADFLTSMALTPLDWLEHGFGTRTGIQPADLATVSQIHSDLVRVAAQPGRCGEADALVTNCPGIAISIRTADCLPIILADPERRAVAAIHAGWRGTAAGIVARAVEKLSAEYGSEPSDLRAAIGPGIGACCYEVGDEVARKFGVSGRIHLDLTEENRRQLITSGVLHENIEALGICTFCDAERFFSYRREKDTAGRQISYVRILSA